MTTGSQHDPLPPGQWKIESISWRPQFHYNPDLFWDAKPGDPETTIQPGPNSPVGVVWIGLDLDHYGLHGTPEPGKSADRLPRVRAADELGRGAARGNGQAGHARGVSMTRKRRDRRIPAGIVFMAFCAGMIFAWWLQSYGPPQPAIDEDGTASNRGGRPPRQPRRREAKAVRRT